MAWTALRDALYVDMLAGELAAVRATGRLLHNEGDGRTSRVAREDCAAVAAAVLADPAPHAGVALDVTGPSLLDAAERGATYARFLGGRSRSSSSPTTPTARHCAGRACRTRSRVW